MRSARPADGLLLVGLVAGLAATAGMPAAPFEITDFVWPAALLGVIVALGAESRAVGLFIALLGWILLSVFALRPLVDYQWSALASVGWLSGIASLAAAPSALSARRARSHSSGAGALLTFWSMAAMVTLFGTGSLLLGLVAGAASVMIFAWTVLDVLGHRWPLVSPGPLSLVAAISVVILCVIGGVAFSSTPLLAGLALLSAPLVQGLLRPLPQIVRERPRSEP